MPIRDRNLDRKRLFKRIPYNRFGVEPTHSHTITLTDDDSAASNGVAVYFDEDATAGSRLLFVSPTNANGSETIGSAESVVGLDDGAPQLTEVSTFGVGGFEIAAAGDSISAFDLESLIDIDLTEPIGIRVLWVENVASPGATDSVTWVVTYKQFDQGEATAAAGTALDTAIALHLPGETAGFKLRRTSRGIINANTFDEAAREGGLIWNVEADAIANYSANEVVFLGLEIDYVPQFYALPEDTPNIHTKQTNSETA